MNYYFDKNSIKSQRYRLGHPIAQQMLFDLRYNLRLPDGSVTFDLTHHPAKISLLAPYQGQRGVMALYELTVRGLEQETHLICAALGRDGAELSDELCAKLWELSGTARPNRGEREEVQDDLKHKRISQDEYDETLERWGSGVSDPDRARLCAIFERKKAAILAEISTRNGTLFDAELDKLDKWARDTKLSMEKELKGLDAEITAQKQALRRCQTLQDKLAQQKQISALESTRSRRRFDLYTAQDDIETQKETLLDDTEQRLQQSVHDECIFTIDWSVI